MNDVQALGIDGARVLHAVPIEADLWHGVDCQRAAGISRYTRETLITRIADLIGDGLVYSVDHGDKRLWVDRAGNTWDEHEYLAPHQYLPKLIPDGVQPS